MIGPALRVAGTVAPGFEAVRDCFADRFAQGEEIGAALHVTCDGRTVVDLWGGSRDAAGARDWTADTPVNVWSCTKGALALLIHRLIERGLIALDAPVARYWPAFAAHGKGGICIHHLLTHTAGLPGPTVLVPDDALYDWPAMVRALEDSVPLWPPGERCAYHAASFGWLNGEVARRVTGRTVRDLIADEIAGPVGSDLSIGLSHDAGPAADLALPPPEVLAAAAAMVEAGGLARRLAITNPARPFEAERGARWRAAEIPSSNGYASARGLARLYTPLALGGTWAGVRLLGPEAVVRAAAPQVIAEDAVSGTLVRRSLGFECPGEEAGWRDGAFGHRGLGGACGFVDPEARLAFGYVTRRMVLGPDTRASALCRAVYDCLA